VLAFGADEVAVFVAAVEQTLGIRREELHRKMDARKAAAGYRQVIGLGSAGGQKQGVVFVEELFGIDEMFGVAVADVGAGHEANAFGSEQINATLHNALIKL